MGWLLVALALDSSATAGEIVLLEGFAKPEDLELVPEVGALLVSEMGLEAPRGGGALSAVVWSAGEGLSGPPRRLWPSEAAMAPSRSVGDSRCVSPPEAATFSGHGLSASIREGAAPLVAVVGHGGREAIEYFDLHGTGSELRARWVGCVELPPDAAGNDVVLEPDGSVLVTNYIPTVHGLRAWLWLQVAALGWDTGSVLHWSPGEGWSERRGSEGAMPNGIVRLGDRVYVAYNGSGTVEALPGRDAERDAPRLALSLPGSPDNLSAAPGGGMLAAVLYETPPGAWSIVSIDAELGGFEVVFEHDGSRLSAVTSVVHDGSRFLLGSMTASAIGALEMEATP